MFFFRWKVCYPGGGGRACLRDAMMYMFCLRAHRFICIIFFWHRCQEKLNNHPVVILTFFQILFNPNPKPLPYLRIVDFLKLNNKNSGYLT